MEFQILYGLQKIHTPILDQIMIFVTKLGDEGIFWLALAVLLLVFKKTRRCGVSILLSMAICYVVGNMALKNIVARPRPCSLDTSVALLVPKPGEFSFPSGHTLHGFAAAGSIFWHFRKQGCAALLLASLIAFSRMYLFVHFPTDILGGVILGMTVSYLVYLFMTKRKGSA